MWETDLGSDGQVEYGMTTSLGTTAGNATPATIHEIALTGLLDNARYYYRVTSGGTTSAINSFATAPATADTPFRFVAYGDTRSYPADHAAVVNAIIPHQPDFVLHVGDYVNSGRIYSEWKPQYFDPAAIMLKNAPLFTVLGNHEYSGTERMWYFDFFSTPDNGSPINREHWYAFTYGSARFVALNACEGGGDSFTPGSEQYNWLVNELQSPAYANARWKFVWFHNPPFTSQERDNPVDADLRAYIVPLLEQYGADIVFGGDDHQYRHSLKSGIHYIVTGGGGAPLHDLGTPMPYATLVYAEKSYEHCVIDVTSTNVNYFAARNDGSIMDSFSLTKAPAPQPPPTPAGLAASAGNATVALSWRASAGAANYNVKRATGNPSGPYAVIATGVVPTNYTDASVVNGTTYYYVVSAVNQAGESPDSAYVGAAPHATPNAPTNLTATSGRKRQIKLTWTAVLQAASYTIKRSTSNGGPYATIRTGVTSTTYTDNKLAVGQTYYYVVSAVNASGESPNSNQASATAK
jgi:hypothetical protein